MKLAEGRLLDVVQANLKAGALLVCHNTTYGSADREVMCRGFYDAYRDRVTSYQVYTRMGGTFEEVDPGEYE